MQMANYMAVAWVFTIKHPQNKLLNPYNISNVIFPIFIYPT